MAKKRKKRKKSSRNRSSKQGASGKRSQKKEKKQGFQGPAVKEFEGILKTDSENRGVRGRVLFKVVEFFPLLAGAMAASRDFKFDLWPFYLLFLFYVLASALSLVFRIEALAKNNTKGLKLKHLILYIGSLITLLFYYNITGSLQLSLFALVLYFLILFIDNLELLSSKKIYCLIFLQPLLMAGFAALSFLSQGNQGVNTLTSNTIASALQLLYPAFLSGILPGLFLSAAIYTGKLKSLKNNAEDISIQKKDKNGEPVVRPGKLSKIFSIFVFLPLAAALVLIPLGLLPSSFLLLGISFYFIPNLAKAFLEESIELSTLSLKTLKTGFLVSILSLAGFILSF